MGTRRGVGTWALETARLVGGAFVRRDAADVYAFVGTANLPGRRSTYVNLGYWETATDYDEAAEALALELGRAAGLGEGDRVLDVGFGFGDQDLLWARTLGPAHIEGINPCVEQVDRARARVAEAGLTHVVLREGRAERTGLPDASIDVVVALESFFHLPRQAFLAEAWRVLVPGGRLAIADPVRVDRPLGAAERVTRWLGRWFWRVPADNDLTADALVGALRSVGFEEVRVRSIGEHVFAPFKDWVRRRQAEPEVVARVNPLLRWAWRRPTVDRSGLDYVIVTARRPVSG